MPGQTLVRQGLLIIEALRSIQTHHAR